MNQSIGANSFEKSLLEKCTDDWQHESANELWKGSSSSVCFQNGASNSTNQVYENLLRICEEIDTALPEIRWTVNKKSEQHINEQQTLPEDNPLDDIFTHNVAFDDIGTSLEDIEIYEDILNASAMMDNDDCIYNQNFDIMKTNQFLQSDTFNDLLTLPLSNSIQRTQCKNMSQYESSSATIFDRAPIFADDEIDQYMASKNLNYSSPFSISRSESNVRDNETVDPLQFWHKLNSGKLPKLCTSKQSPAALETDDLVESKKSTKSVLAILDFTLPSLSSSASSCALSSPEQKDIEIEPTVSKSSETQAPSSNNASKKNLQSGLPVLIAEPNDGCVTTTTTKTNKTPKKNQKKKSKKNKTNPAELLKQDLVLSSPSSSESSLSSVSDMKPVKKRKLNSEQIIHQKSVPPQKSILINQAKNSPIKPSIKITYRNQASPQSTPKCTSPTLKAGAIYIEQQLNATRAQKSQKKVSKCEITNHTPPSNTKHQKHTPKQETPQTPETPSRQKRKETPDSKKANQSNNSTPKSNNKTKRKSSKDKKRSQHCSTSSSPASMPILRSESPISLPKVKKDTKHNKLKPSQGYTNTSGVKPPKSCKNVQTK